MGNDVIEKTNSRIWEILEKIFFGLFLFSIPLQTRLTFVAHETYRRTFFNEYATFFLYLSDILFIITFLLFFVNPVKSCKVGIPQNAELFNWVNRNFAPLTKRVNFSKILNRLSTFPLFIPLSALFLLIAWEFLSIYWSEYKGISFYRSLKLAEFGLLFFYITQHLRWFGFKNLLSIVFITGVFQSAVGILQYLYQHSLGLKILGESVLGPNLAGMAKIVVDGEKIIRAYGTFPHPNVFAGFLILSIFSGFWLLFTSKIEKNALPWISILTAGTILQLAAFTLTFSRVAWLAAIIVITVLLISNRKLFHVKQFDFLALNKLKTFALVIIFIAFAAFLALNWSVVVSRTIGVEQNYQQAISYRLLYNDIAINMIKQNSLAGIGNGNFTLKMADYSSEKLSWWQYQPAHNIYLLITSELGIIGLILFLIFIFSIIKMAYLGQNENHETLSFIRLMLAVFVSFLFIGLFDHYFWTLQQGQLTFWLVLGVLTSSAETGTAE